MRKHLFLKTVPKKLCLKYSPINVSFTRNYLVQLEPEHLKPILLFLSRIIGFARFCSPQKDIGSVNRKSEIATFAEGLLAARI
jgi:hypothetical protein